MTESNVVEKLSVWILDRANVENRSAFNAQTKIIDDGLLTSLDVVELILFIEDLRGEEVDIESLEPASFANIDSLVETFFASLQKVG